MVWVPPGRTQAEPRVAATCAVAGVVVDEAEAPEPVAALFGLTLPVVAPVDPFVPDCPPATVVVVA